MQLSDFDASDNLVSLFLARADELGEKPMLWAKRDGNWTSISWSEAARRVCLIAEGLRGLGLAEGDRVMLVSENRPEWCLSDLGIMAAGCVTVPAYTTNTERDHLHILENSGARAVIVSDEKLAKPLLPAMLRSDVAEGDEQLRREVAEKEKYFQTISDGYLRQFEQIRQDRLIREAKIDQTLKELQKGQETNGRLLERILARLPEGGR